MLAYICQQHGLVNLSFVVENVARRRLQLLRSATKNEQQSPTKTITTIWSSRLRCAIGQQQTNKKQAEISTN